MVCELSELQLLESELEVDAMQLLHLTHNRAQNLEHGMEAEASKLRDQADKLQGQLVSERVAVGQAQRSRLVQFRQSVDIQLPKTGNGNWLTRLQAQLRNLPSQTTETPESGSERTRPCPWKHSGRVCRLCVCCAICDD